MECKRRRTRRGQLATRAVPEQARRECRRKAVRDDRQLRQRSAVIDAEAGFAQRGIELDGSHLRLWFEETH
jgi:hypothetical protein